MTPWDLLVAAGTVIGVCALGLGLIGIIAQVRFEWVKRRAYRDIDRLMKRGHR